MAIFRAEAPRCIVLDELATRSRPDEPATTGRDVAFAAALSHTDDEAISPSTDALAHDIDNSAHVGM